MTKVPGDDGSELNIFEYLSGVEVEGNNEDDEMSYLDAIKLKLTPFPLSHPHVDELLQVYFYLKHLCSVEEAEECLMNDYMFLCFEHQSEIWDMEDDEDDSYEEFYLWWATKVAERFDLAEEDILALFDTETDELDTLLSVDDIWLYGDSLQFDSVPWLIINGEAIGNFATAELPALIAEAFPAN